MESYLLYLVLLMLLLVSQPSHYPICPCGWESTLLRFSLLELTERFLLFLATNNAHSICHFAKILYCLMSLILSENFLIFLLKMPNMHKEHRVPLNISSAHSVDESSAENPYSTPPSHSPFLWLIHHNIPKFCLSNSALSYLEKLVSNRDLTCHLSWTLLVCCVLESLAHCV